MGRHISCRLHRCICANRPQFVTVRRIGTLILYATLGRQLDPALPTGQLSWADPVSAFSLFSPSLCCCSFFFWFSVMVSSFRFLFFILFYLFCFSIQGKEFFNIQLTCFEYTLNAFYVHWTFYFNIRSTCFKTNRTFFSVGHFFYTLNIFLYIYWIFQ